MKNFSIKIALLTLISFGLLSSCSDDESYSLGNQWESLATVHPIDGHAYYLTLDDGTKLGVAAAAVNYTPRENQRVYVNYTLLSDATDSYDHYIKVNGISEILTKGVINLTTVNQDSIGNDPIKIHSLWIGDDYLNIYFEYNSGDQKVHYVNLVNNTIPDPIYDGKIRLEFRHNANEDPAWFARDGFVAFDLRPYRYMNEPAMGKPRDSVDFIIGVQDFKDEYKYYGITYKFNNNTPDIRTSLTYDSNNDATLFR
ncbi:NigD-like protein [Viscerimonas tarda]